MYPTLSINLLIFFQSGMVFAKESQIMSRSGLVSALLFLVLNFNLAWGADYKLTNGDIYRGQAASFNDDGLVVSLDIGGFSPRIPWGKLTQETLKDLANNPEAKDLVEPYIEVPPDVKEQEKKKKKEIRVSEPPSKVPHVESKTGFFAAMANPLGFGLLGALYLANLYAAMEIARFRGRPKGLVLGVSAIAPIIGPALFALLPASHVYPEAPAAPEPAVTEGVNPMQQALPSTMAGSALSVASAGGGKTAANPAYTTVHNRQNATFDRRFFETKFSGFFRVVPADAEKDLVMVVKTPKKEIVATRVSRISASEVHLQLQQGSEASVPFGEITEVSVRPKGAK
jgi:hypothetical protein